MISYTTNERNEKCICLQVSIDEFRDMAPGLDDDELWELAGHVMRHFQDDLQSVVDDLV